MGYDERRKFVVLFLFGAFLYIYIYVCDFSSVVFTMKGVLHQQKILDE